MSAFDIELLFRVEQTVARHELFRPDDTLVVGFSGGADSSMLLDLLTRLSGYRLNLIAAHLNHGLRGEDSDADEEFCRAAASRYGIPFESRTVDVRKVAAEQGLSLEDAGRRARIEFLDEIRGKYGAAAVVLAHHADDQAETVLMRLLRGSGTTGLSGMAYRNARGYVRPLLEIARGEIEQYLQCRRQRWRDDASNADTSYLRNRIRHLLLPLLEEYNPAIRSTLASTAAILGDDEALLEELTAQAFAGSCRVWEGSVACDIPALRALKPALRRRVLRKALKSLVGVLEGVSLRHIDSIDALIESARPNSRLSLPRGISAVREYDRLFFTRSDGAHAESGFELLITAPGMYPLPTGGSIMVTLTDTAEFTEDSGTICSDLGRNPFPWLIRSFRPGDRMTPFGMAGRKKVKDIFIDRKVPLSERRNIPLLLCGEDLIWLAGVCSSELNRLPVGVRSLVNITFTRH